MNHDNNSQLYAGIDIGTSGVRGVCVDDLLNVSATASVSFHPIEDDRRNPQLWLKAVTNVIRKLLEQVDPERVRSIAIDGTSGTMLAVNEEGMPLGTALLYNSSCSNNGILHSIVTHAPVTSAVHGATSGLARAITLCKRHKDASILHEADWIAFQLSGILGVSDENNALKTGYDPVKREWPEWIELTGMARYQLPQVVAAGHVLGPITKKASQATGLHTQTLVVSGTTDGCASFLATGASSPGDGVTVLGSTMTIKFLSDKPVYAPQYGIYSHRIGDRWLAGGASNTGGKVLEAFFSLREIQSLSQAIDLNTTAPENYYPLITPGERFPINDSNLQPYLEPRPTDNAKFLYGMLQGIASIENLSYQRLFELGTPQLKSIRTVGGGARNSTWTTVRKRTLGVKFLPSISEEAAVGCASLARDGFAAHV